jgi:glycosyltransferase involved in cell wall biosynthesis
MRLVAVSHTGQASGAERVLIRVLRAAADEGWDVTCLSPDGPLVAVLEDAGLARRPIPELTLPGGPRLLAVAGLVVRWLRAVVTLRRACAGADVVLANGLLTLPALRLARVRRRVPVAWLVHDVVVRPDRLFLLRYCAPAVDLAVCVSSAVEEALAPFAVATRVVHNGTPWPVEPVPPEPPCPPVVGVNAVLTSWKGQDVLLDAVAALPRRDVVVELMGGRFPKDGGYVASLEARAARPDLAGRIRFLGHVSQPLARMRSWTVMVSPSTDPEAGSLSVVEAMSIGLPVIATAHGGVVEVLGDAGLMVPPRQVDALAAAIEEVLEDPGRFRGGGAPGPAAVARDLRLDRQLGLLLEALAELAGGRDPGPGGDAMLAEVR